MGALPWAFPPVKALALTEKKAAEPAQVERTVIAVDGPAASGKGTIARALAAHFGLPHMDTGMLYRAVALNL
jgi:cytidylate kinase